MNIDYIYLSRKRKILLDFKEESLSKDIELTKKYVATILKNIECYGFTFSKEIITELLKLDSSFLETWYKNIISIIKELVGEEEDMTPMYPNFPQQVINLSDAELYINAIIHYITSGELLPKYKFEERFPLIDNINLEYISLGSKKEFQNIFINLVSSKGSLSNFDKDCLGWYIENDKETLSLLPDEIHNREILAFITSKFIKENIDIEKLFKFYKTATDVLRLATAMSDGDVSLNENTFFKSFTRKERRMLLSILENCNNIKEDMNRHSSKWIRLGERLHPFEFKRFAKANEAFRMIRDNEKILTYNKEVEKYYNNKNLENLIMLLSKRPGEFARGLDRLLRFCIILDEKDCLQLQKYVIRSFEKVATKVSSSILLNLISYFKNRGKDKEVRVFFPKGNMAKAYSKENKLESLEYEICLKVIKVCENALISIYSKREPLNKVFVDERLKKYIVPTSQRNAAKTLKTVERGSRFLIKKETKIIRAFLYWKEPTFERCDLDLSAIFYDENFNRVSYIAYYELRDKKINCCHSGDIVSAPNGASEYVDIDLKKIKNKNVRYIALVVNSYSNQPFCDLPQCFAGYMEREEGELGKIFEPATVRNKADISTAQRVSMPIVIDAYNMEVIWTDLGLNNEPCYENNIETHKKSALMTLKSIVNITKPNIYDLAVLNAMARGELVKTKEEADTIFSLEEGVTPYDIELIMSEYL